MLQQGLPLQTRRGDGTVGQTGGLAWPERQANYQLGDLREIGEL